MACNRCRKEDDEVQINEVDFSAYGYTRLCTDCQQEIEEENIKAELSERDQEESFKF